jgi:TonB family protein
MLHWLRNRSGHSRRQFWIKLLVVSCVCHGLLLVAIFFLYKDDLCQYNMTVNSKNLRPGAPIIFMPFYKVVNAHRLTGQLATSIGAVKTTTVGLSREAVEKKAATSLVDERERKKIAQQQMRARKLKERQCKEKKDRALQERAEKKRKKLEKKERDERLKKAREEEEQKKKAHQQEELHKKEIEVAQKAIQAPSEKRDDPVVQPVHVEQLIVQQESGQQREGGEVAQDSVYIGQIEMEELDRQEELQQALSTCWKPPVGLREGLECVLIFQVDAEGNVIKVTVQKSSGVLVFDMAARMAISHMQMPQWARGKELSITFI